MIAYEDCRTWTQAPRTQIPALSSRRPGQSIQPFCSSPSSAIKLRQGPALQVVRIT